MAITVQVSTTERLVRLTLDASPDSDSGAWESTLEEVVAHPDHRDGFAVLVDGSDAPAPAPDCVRRAVTFLRARHPALCRTRWALVARGPAGYGMMRMAQGLGGHDLQDSEVFSSVESAEAWLAEGRAKKLG